MPTVIGVLIADALGLGNSTLYKLGILGLIFIPLSYAYSLYKRDLLASDLVLHRVLVYLVLGLVFFCCQVGLLHIVALLIPSSLQVPAISSLVTLTLVLLLTPIRRGAEYAVNKALYGVNISYLQASTEALRRLSALDIVALTEVLTRLVPQALQVSQAGVGLIANDRVHWLDGNLRTTSLSAPTLTSEVMQRLKRGQTLAQRADSGAALDLTAPAHWLVPLMVADELQGVWVLGTSQDDESFSLLDHQLVQGIAQAAAIVVKVLSLLSALQEQLDELARAHYQLTVGKEEERAKLAADLHDGVLQSLCGLELAVWAINKQWGGDTELGSALTRLEGQIEQVVVQTREISHGLHSTALEKLGLAASLQTLVAEMQVQHRLTVLLEDIPPGRFQRDIEIAIFGIVREALTNVAKHAQATEALVGVDTLLGLLIVTIEDDGQGFAAEQVKGKRFGLVGMQTRAAGVGGTLHVSSEAGKGTKVEVRIPLPR